MKNLRLLGLLCGVVLFGAVNTAQAGILIEPHLGFNIHGDGSQGSADYDYNGAQYGLKLGYQQLGFMAGLDYNHSSFDLDRKVGGSTTTSAMKRNEIGVFAGYNFPILVRAWAGYYFSNPMKDSPGNEYTGHTTELGVGFTGLPFLSINLMYRIATYDEFESASGAKANVSPTVDLKEIVLGVSLPFNVL